MKIFQKEDVEESKEKLIKLVFVFLNTGWPPVT